MHISQLVHKFTQAYDTVSEEASTSLRRLALICHYKRRKLKLRIFGDLQLGDRQVKHVCRKDWILSGCRDIGPSFFAIPIQLYCDKVVELFGKAKIFKGNLQVAPT